MFHIIIGNILKNMSELTIHMPAKFKYEKQKMQDNLLLDLAEHCQEESTQLVINFLMIP